MRIDPLTWDDPPTEDAFVSFVPMAAVEAESGRLDPSQSRPWHAVRRDRTTFQEGDILYARGTPALENGKVALAEGLLGGRGVGSSECFVFRVREGLLPRYLLHFLLQESVRSQVQCQMIGATGQMRLPRSALDMIWVPIAPLADQHRIVETIERHLAKLDAGVARLNEARADLSRYRAAVQLAACEGQLVPTEAARAERRGYEPADHLLTRIAEARMGAGASRPPLPIAREVALPDLPEGWCWASADELLIRLHVGVPQSPHDEAGTAVLRASAVRPLHVDTDDVRFLACRPDDIRRFLVQPGDLLFVRGSGSAGLVGACAAVGALAGPVAHSQKLIRGVPIPDLISPEYLAIALNTGISRRFLQSRVRASTGRSILSRADIRVTPVPLPPLPEQRRIAEEVTRRLGLLAGMGAAVVENLHQAERLREAIRQSAFSGRLVGQETERDCASDVRAWTTADGVAEPASIGETRPL